MTRKFLEAAAWLVLGLVFVGADLIGNLSAYGYAAIICAALPIIFMDRTLRPRMFSLESALYAASFLLLVTAFAFSAKTPSDMQYAGNFLFFLMFAPAVALFATIRGPGASTILARLALLGAAVSLGWALYEVHILGVGRVVGFINLTNPYAMAAVMLGFLATVGFFSECRSHRFIFLLGPILATGTAILAGTRSAIVMIAALGLIFIAFWLWSLKGKARLIAGTLSAVVVVLGCVALLTQGDSFRALSAFSTIGVFFGQGTAADFSTEIRLNLYYGGLMAFLDSPIFGHGWWHHVEAARPYMSEIVQQNTVKWSHLHNDYVNFAALAGVMGLVAYFLYMTTPIIGAARSARDNQFVPRLYAACIVGTSYAVFGLFDTSFSMEVLLGFGPVCTAAILGFCVDAPSDRSNPAQS